MYYDRLGLLKPSGRTGSGYRYYTDADQRRLKRIGFFREAGLTLKEIRAVLSSGGKPGTKHHLITDAGGIPLALAGEPGAPGAPGAFDKSDMTS